MLYLARNRVTSKAQTQAPHNRSRTGYGSKLPTSWLLQIDGKRWHRVYVICFSNSGSAYILIKGEPHYLGSYDPSDPMCCAHEDCRNDDKLSMTCYEQTKGKAPA